MERYRIFHNVWHISELLRLKGQLFRSHDILTANVKMFKKKKDSAIFKTLKVSKISQKWFIAQKWWNYVCLFRAWDGMTPLALSRHSLFVKCKRDYQRFLNGIIWEKREECVLIGFFQLVREKIPLFWTVSDCSQLLESKLC